LSQNDWTIEEEEKKEKKSKEILLSASHPVKLPKEMSIRNKRAEKPNLSYSIQAKSDKCSFILTAWLRGDQAWKQ